MFERSSACASAILAAVLLLPPLVGVYAAGYLLLGRTGARRDGRTVVRLYRSKPLKILFTPAAATDSWITRREIQVAY